MMVKRAIADVFVVLNFIEIQSGRNSSDSLYYYRYLGFMVRNVHVRVCKV